MMKIAMSRSGNGLLRALLDRAGAEQSRVLLTDWRSVDWQSLTFVGERHHIGLRIIGDGAGELARRLTDGIGDAEFSIPSQIVADIIVAGEPRREADGAVVVTLEALTIAE